LGNLFIVTSYKREQEIKMKLTELIASFDKRADETKSGDFYLTLKQYNFALSLAAKEGLYLPTIAKNLGVYFKLNVGPHARFFGKKSFALQLQYDAESQARTRARIQAEITGSAQPKNP
jgi:hypothetical protein